MIDLDKYLSYKLMLYKVKNASFFHLVRENFRSERKLVLLVNFMIKVCFDQIDLKIFFPLKNFTELLIFFREVHII